MAERKYFAILTDIGQQKVAAFASGGEKVNITAFVVGDANGEYYTPTTDMTAIKNEVWRGVVSNTDVVKDAQNVIRVSNVIPADVNGFIVREMGLYDESGQLIAIGNAPPMPKVMLEEGVSTELDLSMRFAVKNTEALTFVTDPHTVIMTKDMLDTHNVDNNAHKELLDKKVDENTFTTELAKKVDETKLTTELAKKVDETKLTTELAKKANTSHSHSVSDITSTMTIAKGGTGATSASTALSNLGGFPSAGGTITGNTTIQGNLTLKGSGNYGNKINFGDGDYVHISEPTDDNMEIKASNVNFVVSGNITQNGNKIGGGATREQIESALAGNGAGNSNVALGVNALVNNTTGNYNMAIGRNALRYNTTGENNIAMGGFTLFNNTTGDRNTAIGESALYSNKIGSFNTAVGFSSLAGNIDKDNTGKCNTAIGSYSLENITFGNCNVGIGFGALMHIEESENNTAIGFLSLSQAGSESANNVAIGAKAMGNKFNFTNNTFVGSVYSGITNNTAVGIQALGNITSNANTNTAIGYFALGNLTTYYNCTGLGNNSQVTGNNQVQLGDTSATVYAQKALVTRSDARDKIDIEDSPLGLNFILKLRPRKYRMNSRETYFEQGKERDFSAVNDGSKAGKRPHYGLVAQEVKEVMNELNVDFAGYLDSKVDGGEDVLSLGYTEFIAPMIKAIQEQQNMIEALQKQIEELKK